MSWKDELFFVFKEIGKQTYKTSKEVYNTIKDIAKEEGLTKENLAKSENVQELKKTIKDIL